VTGHRIRSRQSGSFVPGVCGGSGLAQVLLLAHLTPQGIRPSPCKPIISSSIVPEITKWTLLWSLNSSFRIFYTFGLRINFSL
jgi:hypothetical protein